jgi:hypothetical protein
LVPHSVLRRSPARPNSTQAAVLDWGVERDPPAPINGEELGRLRDDGARRAKTLDSLADKLRERLCLRLDRLATAADDGSRQDAQLPEQHARTVAAVQHARALEAEYEGLVRAVGLDANAALRQHSKATSDRATLAEEIIESTDRVDGARSRVQELTLKLEQATDRVAETQEPVAAAQRQLRTLVEVAGRTRGPVRTGHGNPWALGRPRAGRPDRRPRRPGAARQTYGWSAPARERYDTSRAEESALRNFVIGRLPLAIGTAWVSIEDWTRDVNRKMQKAAASSGVGVRISRTLRRDLSAAELTVYRLACKETTLTAAQQAEVGQALQALIAGADGTTMSERLANAIDVRRWLDISYEIIRPDGQVSRWTSKTGLSGGERRLVVVR